MCKINYVMPSIFYSVIKGIYGTGKTQVINFFIDKHKVTYNTKVPDSPF